MTLDMREAGGVPVSSQDAQNALRQQITSQINAHQGRLFINDTEKFNVFLWVGYRGKTSHTALEIKSPGKFEEYFSSELMDEKMNPGSLHVFLSAGNSQKPLNCTVNEFKALCARLHVIPKFVEMLMSFGEPKEYDFAQPHQPQCYQEHSVITLKGSNETPSMGAIANMTNIYKLSGIESLSEDSFSMRQLAVHQSFNFFNGQFTSVSVKANHHKISRAITSINNGAVPHTISTAFSHSLDCQLLNFRWSVEGWPAYISSQEHQIQQILLKLHSIPVSRGGKDVNLNQGLFRARTMHTDTEVPPSPRHIQNQRSFRQQSFKSIGSILSEAIHTSKNAKNSADTGVHDDQKKEQDTYLEKQNQETVEDTIQRIKVLQEFPFKGVQKLGAVSHKLKEAKLVMSLNAKVLQETREYLEEIFCAPEFPVQLKTDCSAAFTIFQRQVKYLEKQLSMECMRTDLLMQLAGDGKSLYDSILQLQGAETSYLFAMDAVSTSMKVEKSTKRMERVTLSMHEIARNTERDTASMHVITFFALVFLPGTFLGVRLLYSSLSHQSSSTRLMQSVAQSFFSTPIFGEQKEGSPNAWEFNRPLFHLFWIICAPMMIVMIILWSVYLLWKSKRSRLRRETDAERGLDAAWSRPICSSHSA